MPPATRALNWTVVGAILACSPLAGCTKESAAAKSQPARQSAAVDTNANAVLATIGDEKLTLADVRAQVGERLDQVEATYRRSRDKLIESALDTIIQSKLMLGEVKKTGKTADELLAAEAGGPLEPTPVEIASWYKENQSRVQGRPLEQVSSQIADFLRGQRRKAAAEKLSMRLRTERKVAIDFEPYRLEFNNSGAPTAGKKDALVTLVEFSDFQCPYCKSAAPGVREIEKKYGDKVLIVYRQYPITSLHPNAFKAAEASLCANEQGKFWALHDVMFEDQSKLAVADLKATARRLGMDGNKFDSCLDSGRYVEQVQNDQKEGARVGVNGTPTLFVNGVATEAWNYGALSALLDKELARVKH